MSFEMELYQAAIRWKSIKLVEIDIGVLYYA